MAEEQQAQAPRQRQAASSSSGTSKSESGPKRGPGLAPIQGEAATDERPAERQPGTPEHLGENPYQGGDSPFVEGDEDARNR